MSNMRSARVSAFAKINLDLRVLGKRPDGYHEIRTVFQTISLADRLEISFTPARATTIEVAGNLDIPHQENLVVKAAGLVLDAVGRTGRVNFRLEKKIPMGAGLGGGSSDAAAVLLTLPVLAGAAIEPSVLLGLGAALGSDVPFFLLGGAAVAVGRGTELYPLPDGPARAGVLVTSALRVSSADAYRALSPRLTSEAQQNKIVSFQLQTWAGNWDTPRNDFETVVLEQHPELARSKQRLEELGARPALMTGSGSAIYGLFRTRGESGRALKAFRGEPVFPITTLSRARYRSYWWRRLEAHMTNDKLWPPHSRYAQ
jgi:4-diphosphocytidyl-2-C-methyl-D-erythritol kinase